MAQTQVKPIPEGMPTLTPHIVCANALEAIEFYKRAFGAVEEFKLVTPQGQLMHAMLRIGDSPVMMGEEMPEWQSLGPKTLKGTPV
ncbi:VOC family protein, partial [Acinetobacter baumannii]